MLCTQQVLLKCMLTEWLFTIQSPIYVVTLSSLLISFLTSMLGDEEPGLYYYYLLLLLLLSFPIQLREAAFLQMIFPTSIVIRNQEMVYSFLGWICTFLATSICQVPHWDTLELNRDTFSVAGHRCFVGLVFMNAPYHIFVVLPIPGPMAGWGTWPLLAHGLGWGVMCFTSLKHLVVGTFSSF